MGIKLRPKSNHRKTIEFTGSTKHYSRKHKRSAYQNRTDSGSSNQNRKCFWYSFR
jgi:hypothetical protein